MPLRRKALLRGAAFFALAGALVWGRTHAAPDLEGALAAVFPDATRTLESGDVLAVYSAADSLLGWAGTGTAHGYGGPLLVFVGIDPNMAVVGIEVVEHRETPVFWSSARPGEYVRAMKGLSYSGLEYDYSQVVSVSGATLSTTAITQAVRAAVSGVADEAFGAPLPAQRRPFEFGLLELGIAVHPALRVVARQVEHAVVQRVESGQRDELELVAHRAKLALEASERDFVQVPPPVE